LYKESKLDYLVSDHENPGNHPIYTVEDEIKSSIFHISDDSLEPLAIIYVNNQEKEVEHEVWKMFFDGSSSKEGSYVGVVFISPAKEVIPFSYKLEFYTTNNIVEYEALLLGLRDTKEMGIDKIVVFGDS
jgi:hypothetical protein